MPQYKVKLGDIPPESSILFSLFLAASALQVGIRVVSITEDTEDELIVTTEGLAEGLFIGEGIYFQLCGFNKFEPFKT